MPTIHKVYWGIFIVAGLILMEFLSRPGSPQFFKDIVDSYKKDEAKMASIGGYESYEYEYNSKQLNKDTLDYLITIHGRSGRISLTGRAVIKDNTWQVIEQISEGKDNRE